MNLALNLRPTVLSEFVGQEHLLGKGKIVSAMLTSGNLFSLIFWGPPGTGKTTLAYLIAQSSNADIHFLSGVESGKDDLRKVVEIAKGNKEKNKRTILFIDEIHRWNKAQQDVLLPHVESGLLVLMGATTENPSFEIISALLSRSKVLVLNSLTEMELEIILDRALSDQEKGLGKYKRNFAPEAKELLIRLSGGDARVLLNAIELAATNFKDKEISEKIVQEVFQTKSAGLYDKKAEEHYNTISAFIKSMRGSDPDGALYYLSRMLLSGEDPKFIARRMIIFASEDIGLADRGALIQANACFEAVNKIGMPESGIILAHGVLYLATAKKSRGVANALGKAMKAATDFPNEPIPLHLRNAPTKLMKELGYAKDYTWNETYVGPKEGQIFLPEKLKGKKFWEG